MTDERTSNQEAEPTGKSKLIYDFLTQMQAEAVNLKQTIAALNRRLHEVEEKKRWLKQELDLEG